MEGSRHIHTCTGQSADKWYIVLLQEGQLETEVDVGLQHDGFEV